MTNEIPEDIKTVVSLISASHGMTNSMTTQMIEDQKNEIKRLKAEIAAIRTSIAFCFDSPYMPRENTIIAATYPSQVLIEEFMNEE